MPITPAVSLSMKWVESVIATLARCASYRSFVGAADEAAAKASTYFVSTPYPANASEDFYAEAEWNNDVLPCVILMPTDGGFFDLRRIATGPTWNNSQSIVAVFRRLEPSGHVNDPELAAFSLCDAVAAAVEEFSQLAGTIGNCDATTIQPEDPPGFFAPRDEAALGRVQQWAIRIGVGLDEN